MKVDIKPLLSGKEKGHISFQFFGLHETLVIIRQCTYPLYNGCSMKKYICGVYVYNEVLIQSYGAQYVFLGVSCQTMFGFL